MLLTFGGGEMYFAQKSILPLKSPLGYKKYFA